MPSVVEIAGSSAILAAVAATCVGSAACWANPHRRVNLLFFSASIHVAIWLVVRQTASVGQDLGLYRITTAVGALMHFHLWLIKESVARSSEPFRAALYRGRWLMASGFVLAALSFTEWFIPTPVEAGRPHEIGIGFYVYVIGLASLFGELAWTTFRQVRLTRGVQRIELQLLLLGGSGAAILVISLMIARAIAQVGWTVLVVPYVILIFYAATVVGITTSRVFDARQLLLFIFHRSSLVVLVSIVALPVWMLIAPLISDPVAMVITVALSLSLAGILRRKLDRVLQYYPRDGSARQAILAAAQEEKRVDRLEEAFKTVLKGWGHADVAFLGSYPKARPGSRSDTQNGVIVASMRELRWATPERIFRERRTEGGDAIGLFMRDNELGVLVVEDGLSLSVLVGVGVPASRRPYTYPQVKELMEIASVIGSALERAHFANKMQHTERLATVGLLGASLAHEIRNPLVSIKTFVQLLPQHYGDAKFRNKFFRLILDEVGRIDQLTDQLLDLATPRNYIAQRVELHNIVQASLDLVAAKAAHKGVELIAELKASPDYVYTDASAARQVALNLCFNAIQAVEGHSGDERWVRVTTLNRANALELIVSDSGPGVSPEIRPKLFQPFHTTKSTGFGLGLAICRDILENLNAAITVDPYETGKGATFRVTFPCQPT